MTTDTDSSYIFDILIIGAGMSGVSLAYQLFSEYKTKGLKIGMLDAGSDFASGATRANSGIIHSSSSFNPGSLKARLATRGNILHGEIASRLAIPFQRCGAMVLGFSGEDEGILERLLANNRKNIGNRKSEVKLIPAVEALRLEPAVNHDIQAALLAPDAGIISPYESCIAMGEWSIEMGLRCYFSHRVTGLASNDNNFTVFDVVNVHSGKSKQVKASLVINAAGGGAVDIAGICGDRHYAPKFRRGEYLLFRRGTADMLSRVIFQPPNSQSKGVLVTPTVWGNLMIGPNSEDIDDPADTRTSQAGLEDIKARALRSIPSLPFKSLIRDFAGIRSGLIDGDFRIEKSQSARNIVHVLGIDSPGLTAGPAIGEMLAGICADYLGIVRGSSKVERKSYIYPRPLSPMSKIAGAVDLLPGDRERIICRCEQIREGEICDSLDRSLRLGLKILSLDSVKFRTRVGMGACQGQFCRNRVRELLSRSYSLDVNSIHDSRPADPLLNEIIK